MRLIVGSRQLAHMACLAWSVAASTGCQRVSSTSNGTAPAATTDGSGSAEALAPPGMTRPECRPACSQPPCTLADAQPLPLRLALDDRSVYWTTRGQVVDHNFRGGTVSRVDKAGGGVVVLVPDQSGATDLAMDGDSLYWATDIVSKWRGDAGPSTTEEYASVRRAAKDGSGVTVLVPGLTRAQGLAVDDSSVYFEALQPASPGTDEDFSGLYAVPKAGGTLRRLGNADGTRAILPDGDHLLFTREFPGAILRVPKGGGPVSVLLGDDNDPWPVTMDRSRIFWATYGTIGSGARSGNPERTVMSANRDGTDRRRLATLPLGRSGSRALALDDSHVYWIQAAEPPATDSRIMRARKDGTQATVLAAGQYEPTDLGVDDCSVFWGTLGSPDGMGAIRSTPK